MDFTGKALADLRNKQIKEMLLELENRRDVIYDEVANRQGQITILEDIIKKIYDRIVDVNKEVQQQELKAGVEAKAREEEEARAKKKQEQDEAFVKAKQGIKTPKLKQRKRSKKK